MKKYRPLLILVLIITTVVILFPTPAYAVPSTVDFLLNPGGQILQMLVGLMEAIHKIIVQMIVWLGGVLNWVIRLEANYGGATVYNVWKIFRDICNSLFIVFFIVIAFSTIFNSVIPSLKPYYWSSALQGVILAALLINFSLPIGQTIVWAGNRAASIVAGLMPKVNIAETVFVQSSVLKVSAGVNGLSLSSAPFESIPDSQLDATQIIVKNNYTGNAKVVLENCLKSRPDQIAECSELGARAHALQTSVALDKEIGNASKTPTLLTPLQRAFGFFRNIAGGTLDGAVALVNPLNIIDPIGLVSGAGISGFMRATKDIVYGPTPAEPTEPTTSESALSFLSLLINNLFLGILALDFLVVVAFLLLRIPATWFYLSVSALAFFTIGIPGSKTPKEWFGNIIGWSIFAPLYLFVIYIGMFVLGQQGALLSGLKDVGAFASIFGIGLFYLISGFIFIIGAAAAWKYAFSLSSSLQTYAGGWADTFGVGAKDNFGFGLVAKRTGATAAYQGTAARVKEGYESRFVKPQERFEEEVKARFQGGKAQESLQRKRIDEAIKSNKESGKLTADLKADLTKGSGPQYLAAANQLLDSHELDPLEIVKYQAAAQGISPLYGRIVKDQIDRKVVEKAKDKKYKTGAEAIAALAIYAPDPTDTPAVAAAKTKMRDDILKSIEKNQPLIAADLATGGLYPGRTPQDIVKGNFAVLENKDVLKIIDKLGPGGPWGVDPDFEKLVAGKNRKLADHLGLMSSASATQQAYITAAMVSNGIRARP